MKIKGVIFDLDGTLLDTISDIANAMNRVLKNNQLPEHSVEDYKYFVGDGVSQLVKRSLPEKMAEDSAFFERILSEMAVSYEDNLYNLTRPYDGIKDMLAVLKGRGLKLAVLSNKPHTFAVKAIEHFFPNFEFDCVTGAVDDFPRKPHPAGAFWVAEKIDVAPDDCLYLGDTRTDMMTAQGAGMFPVGVLWGFRDAEELLLGGAMYLIDDPLEVLDLLE